jgi:hypothetical protein
MELEPGARLAHYEIIAGIGKGASIPLFSF